MRDTKELYLVGVSFRTAPAAVREALSFREAEIHELLRSARAEMPAREALILSTCNRTEFYLAAPPAAQAVDDWLARLRRLRPSAPILREECRRYQLQGTAVVEHLLRVTCGLDSAILGDTQILGQVKESLRIASACRSLGGYLQHAVNQAVAAGKRARQETTISSGSAGIGSAIASLLATRASQKSDRPPTIAICGAGETACSIVRHLSKRGPWRFLFLNRTETKAKALAAQYSGDARPWSDLNAALLEADIVVTAIAAAQPFLRSDVLEQLAQKRGGQRLLVVDAGMPRNAEPTPAVDLIDIDAVREQQERTHSLRQSAAPAVERIVEEFVESWTAWKTLRPIEESIKRLYQDAAEHRREMSRQLAASESVPLDQADRIVWKSLRHVLHLHSRRLRNLGMTKVRVATSRS